MTCFMCRGCHLEDKETTFMVDANNCIIIVKNVPSQVCSQCGEVSYRHQVSKQLEKIVDIMRTSFMEIAVTSYSD
ncbi:MAG: hypothetical protein H6Q70_2064 [Firmicutes bacterium]|nr:hypothetical protein [Bacillota bacterium]